MEAKNDITFPRVIFYGMLTEFVLVFLQFLYLQSYATSASGGVFTFTSDYMMAQGFYVFQVIGFFVYSILVFAVIRKIDTEVFYKILVLIIAGVAVELAFYAIIPANYELAYFYSVLDKFMGGVFGAIVFFYSGRKE